MAPKLSGAEIKEYLFWPERDDDGNLINPEVTFKTTKKSKMVCFSSVKKPKGLYKIEDKLTGNTSDRDTKDLEIFAKKYTGKKWNSFDGHTEIIRLWYLCARAVVAKVQSGEVIDIYRPEPAMFKDHIENYDFIGWCRLRELVSFREWVDHLEGSLPKGEFEMHRSLLHKSIAACIEYGSPLDEESKQLVMKLTGVE